MDHAWQRLWAVTPIDGRYAEHLENLGGLFSEAALITKRAFVEAQWLLHLTEIPEIAAALGPMPPSMQDKLKSYSDKISSTFLEEVKREEQTTRHDVKAVEYVMRQQLKNATADSPWLAMLHFACTSEDINNLAYALMLREVREQAALPQLDSLIRQLAVLAANCANMGMLSRTHGQSASPTTMGKEIAVFGQRLLKTREALAAVTIRGKINGAVGNFNAHSLAFPDIDWLDVSERFVAQRLGLAWNPLTTQIENHDWMANYADALRHTNTILLGLCRDIWGYISLGYYTQKTVAGEVGSSTMPHKINPIDFENAEGNLGIANALAAHLSEKLPISRWQRDLSDSTAQRAWGEVLGHSLLAYHSLERGLTKLVPAPDAMLADLDEAWEVLTEAVQTVMRRYGVVDAYERLKAISRGQAIDAAGIKSVLDACPQIPAKVRDQLTKMRPRDYVGIAPQLSKLFVDAANKTGH